MIHTTLSLFAASNGTCEPSGGSLLGLPTWYKYLPGIEYTNELTNTTTCLVRITSLNDFWLIAAAIIELLLRLGALVAIGFIVYGGVQFITSEGSPDKAQKAIGTVVNACIGLAITIASTAAVTFIAGRF